MPAVRAERFGHLTHGEVASILERIRAMDDLPQMRLATWGADVIEALFLTGLRRAELARLRVEDVDVFRGKIRARGKCGDRTLPIGARLKPVLLRLIDDADADGCVIASRGESTDGRANRALRRWRERFKIPNLHPRALRQSFATFHVDAGTPPHVPRELLGHATLQMTLRYYHSSGKEAQAAMDRIGNALAGTVDGWASPAVLFPNAADDALDRVTLATVQRTIRDLLDGLDRAELRAMCEWEMARLTRPVDVAPKDDAMPAHATLYLDELLELHSAHAAGLIVKCCLDVGDALRPLRTILGRAATQLEREAADRAAKNGILRKESNAAPGKKRPVALYGLALRYVGKRIEVS